MARCDVNLAILFFISCYTKKLLARRTVRLGVLGEGAKGKEEFSMEYYENDWDMDWDIIEDMYGNLSEDEIEEELMDIE